MGNSTPSVPQRKPEKAKRSDKDFPLRVHKGTGYWCKKVRGRLFYFGKVKDDPNGVAALAQWLDERDDLLAGREPRERKGTLTVEDLCFRFLAHQEAKRDNGEISPRTYQTNHGTAEFVAKSFGRSRAVSDLASEDFRQLKAKIARTRGLVAQRNEMQRVRSIFKFAFDDGLIDAPVRFGKGFEKPPIDAVSRAREANRAENGDRMFEADELRKILAASGPGLQAMVLLAANGGLGQSDISRLTVRAVNLETGWLDFARVKTGVPRRIPLWPETVSAIREWLEVRPKARNHADAPLMFLTQRGLPWVKLNATGSPSDAVGQEFAKVVKALGLKRPGVSFYALRHGFETVGGETADQVAVDAIMGHKTPGMSGAYRERIGDDRLRRVVEHVRKWLFAEPASPPPEPPEDDTPEGRQEAGELTPQSCYPCVPCYPAQENEGEERGRTEAAGTQAGSQAAPPATPESPWIPRPGAQGSQGTQNRVPYSARPVLRLFVGEEGGAA